MDESTVLTSLKEGTQNKFLGVLENLKEDDKLALEVAAKVFLRRMSVIWSRPLSDFNRVIASNQFALTSYERRISLSQSSRESTEKS